MWNCEYHSNHFRVSGEARSLQPRGRVFISLLSHGPLKWLLPPRQPMIGRAKLLRPCTEERTGTVSIETTAIISFETVTGWTTVFRACEPQWMHHRLFLRLAAAPVLPCSFCSNDSLFCEQSGSMYRKLRFSVSDRLLSMSWAGKRWQLEGSARSSTPRCRRPRSLLQRFL